jgi:protein-S-isoprenylcysteine O-methyltransferase Ste14
VSDGPRTALSEPRLVGLALAAVAVLVLCIGALFATDDVWIVVLIVPAIVLAAVAVAVVFWRMLAAGGDNVSTADADDATDPVERGT